MEKTYLVEKRKNSLKLEWLKTYLYLNMRILSLYHTPWLQRIAFSTKSDNF